MSNFKLEIYIDEKGKSSFADWQNSLDKQIQKRINFRLIRLQEGNFDDNKKLAQDLYELRLKFGSGYRIYYTVQNQVIVILLSGGDKSTQQKDIENAKKYLKNVRGDNNE